MISRERRAWSGMIYRCSTPGIKGSENYVDKGVTVHPEWVESIDSFISYVGPIPDSRRWSIERIDSNGNYEPGNVKWALPSTQNRNRNKFRSNTSGNTGVCVRERGGKTRYIARWYDLNGKSCSKSFLEGKYQNPEKEAIDYRNKKIAELNELGAGYSDKHGE